MSAYRCKTRHGSPGACSNGYYISDLTIGNLVFPLFHNVFWLVNNIDKVKSIARFEKILLQDISEPGIQVEPEYVELLYHFLKKTPDSNAPKFTNERQEIISIGEKKDQAAELQTKRDTLVAANDRLTNLYLFDPSALPPDEFIKRRREISAQIEEIDRALETLSEHTTSPHIFSLQQMDMGGFSTILEYITKSPKTSFHQLLLETPKEDIHAFMSTMLSRIYMVDGRVTRLWFANDLSISFSYNTPPAYAQNKCTLCGQRMQYSIGCRARTLTISGKKYRRIVVGDANDSLSNRIKKCPDCGAAPGVWHHALCPRESCPVCGLPIISCEHSQKTLWEKPDQSSTKTKMKPLGAN